MSKVREVLRLVHACGVSERVITQSIDIGCAAVAEYLRQPAGIGLTYPIPQDSSLRE